MSPSFSVINQYYMYTIINKDIFSLLEHHTLRRNILGKTHGLETQQSPPPDYEGGTLVRLHYRESAQADLMQNYMVGACSSP